MHVCIADFGSLSQDSPRTQSIEQGAAWHSDVLLGWTDSLSFVLHFLQFFSTILLKQPLKYVVTSQIYLSLKEKRNVKFRLSVVL